MENAFYKVWRDSVFSQCYDRNIEHRKEQFVKHVVGFINSLNQATQNQSNLLEQMLNQNDNLFPKAVRIFLNDPFFNMSIRKFGSCFEARGRGIDFLELWNIYQNSEYFLGRDLKDKDDFTSLSPTSYTPWLRILSWQRKRMGFKADLGNIDKMITFLKLLKQIEDFSESDRMLYYFVLSELHLHPKRTGGPDLETAQKLVDDIAAEHPLKLFDPELPARVLEHCAEMRLKPYQALLVTPSSGSAWQPEFLRAMPKILPALHALLHWRTHPETASASENLFDSEPEINSISEEYLKVILQKFNPAIFVGKNAENLPKKESFLDQVYFTALPRLIEYFMRADKVLKDHIASLTTQNQATNILLRTMQTTLEQYRLKLAELFCNEIQKLLSLKSEDKMISLQEQETLIKKKILAHVLNWTTAILQQEENRLTQRLAVNPEKALQHSAIPLEIAVLQDGREEINRWTQRCVNKDIGPMQHIYWVKSVLNEVEQKGGAHNSFLTVVARVAANLVIFLSAGLLHLFFKKQIQETRAAPVTGLSQYFFSVKSRRAETIHSVNAVVGCGKK